MEISLNEIGLKYGTDKAIHGYLQFYERVFASFRHQAFDLLEIGVRTGESVRMWHEYFPQARIVGLDIESISLADEKQLPRYAFVQGSQNDPEVLGQLLRDYVFRVIVDDGSHVWSDQIFTFQTLFPSIEDGGVYGCEDIHTSYSTRSERFRGSAEQSAAAFFLRLAEVVVPTKTRKLERAVDAELLTIARKTGSITFVQHGVIVTAEPAPERSGKIDRRSQAGRRERRTSRPSLENREPMNPRNVVLTGLPRAGTTLTCQLLNKLPDTVALHEPMRGRHVAGDVDNRERGATVQQFFEEQRVSILTRGRASSRTIDGVIPENPFGAEKTEAGLRRHLDAKGEMIVDKDLSPEFTLVIKHISSFAAMLESLMGQFPVYAIIRNPLAVLASWSTLDARLQHGHVGPAEKLDRKLREQLTAREDPLDRQLCLLHWFFEQFSRCLPDRSIIRYESLIESGGQALAVIRPEAKNLTEPLTSRNANELYSRQYVLRAGERLLASDGAYWQFYSKPSVELLIAEFETTPALSSAPMANG